MNRKPQIESMLRNGQSLVEIGKVLNVSKQRIHQLIIQYGIQSLNQRRKGFWKNQSIEHRWLIRTLRSKYNKKKNVDIKALFSYLKNQLPSSCPIFGFILNYSGGTIHDREHSPSIDRIDSSKGYVIGNVHIISWKANRIKNNSTLQELRQLLSYLERLPQ